MRLISNLLDGFLSRENRFRLSLNRTYVVVYRVLATGISLMKGIDLPKLRMKARAFIVRKTMVTRSSPGFQALKWLGPVGLKIRRLGATWTRRKLASDFTKFGLDACDVYFINLDHRFDRLAALKKEFKDLGIKAPVRLRARKHDIGSLGCSMSHLDLLSHYEAIPSRLLMICEDDCEFRIPRAELSALISEFQKDKTLDVLCLAFNTTKPNQVLNLKGALQITADTQTTACYVLKSHMVEKMMLAALESVSGLERTGDPTTYAIDIIWKKLQARYLFAIPKYRAVIQTESFSDIENRVTNYGV